MVQNRSLSFSLEQAYHDHIPNKKFPIGVINIQVPFDEIDVNIHPAKTEVRLINENQIIVPHFIVRLFLIAFFSVECVL